VQRAILSIRNAGFDAAGAQGTVDPALLASASVLAREAALLERDGPNARARVPPLRGLRGPPVVGMGARGGAAGRGPAARRR
jgi:hypothetical protein